MAEESFQEKTEPATDKKRGELREKGKVPRSMEVNSGAVLLAGLMLLLATSGLLMKKIMEMMQAAFSSCGTPDLTRSTVPEYVLQQVISFGIIVGPVIIGLMITGFLAGFLQVGPLFTFDPMLPKFTKLNPFTGIKKVIISRRSLVELLKSVAKAAIIGIIGYVGIQEVIADSVQLMDGDAITILSFIGTSSVHIALKTGIIYVAIAVFDFFYQKREYERDIRMTKEEVKEENKQLEGDPQIKGRIRRAQRQLARQRMMQNVPKADVVITNPTHYAVALQYDADEMNAPVVVAKGMNLIAQKIKTIAAEHGIPVVEDKPLAQSLYKSVEIDQPIPANLFQAVAQVLAYIYQMKKRQTAFGAF